MKVLIAIDESRYSDLALESVKLRVWDPATEFCVCSIVPDSDSSRFLNETQQIAVQRAQRQQFQYFNSIVKAKVQELKWVLPGNPVQGEVRVGPVAESIIDLAIELETDLIVLGSHGRRGMARYALGSVVESVATAAPCAIEIIRMSHSPSQTNDDQVPAVLVQNRFLLGYDGSANAKAAIDWVAHSQWMPDQEFVVLTVLAPPDDDRLSVKNRRANIKARSEILKDAERILESAITPLRQNPNLRLVQPEVCEGYAAETILRFAEQWCADVIILGAHAAAPTENPLFGSVARHVAADAPCSVRILRQQLSLASYSPTALPAENHAQLELLPPHANLPAIIRPQSHPVSQWAIDRIRRANADSAVSTK
jgi:nucleotide-binding universal stress UspA family protein